MKLHPYSIPYRILSRGASVGLSLVFVAVSIAGSGELPALAGPAAIAVAVAVVALAAAWQVAYYRRFEYELTDDGLEIASGVLSRRNREIPLGRVQNVDISRNVVQRALGIAVLDLETAGGGGTEASLQYVGYDEAKRLQREIQRLKRRADRAGDAEAAGDEAGAGAEAYVPPEEREELLFALQTEELALLSLLSFDFRYLSLLAFGPAAVPFVPGVTELGFVSGLAVVGMVVLAVLLALVLWAISAVVTFARYYGFRLTRVGDDLRYERGLLQRYDGSIPLGKVQTLTLRENVLMRRFGYATLAVETAGYGPGQAPAGGSEAAVPLATRERAVQLAQDVEPFDPPEFTRPPERARTRYAIRFALGVAALVAVLAVGWLVADPPVAWYVPLAPLALVALAPVAARLTWRNRGYAVGEDHVFTRSGFWDRTTKVVPYYRVQTVIQRRTLFQRRERWRLAHVVIDTASSAGGVAAALDLDADDATRLRELVGRKLQESLAERRGGDGASSRGTDAGADSSRRD